MNSALTSTTSYMAHTSNVTSLMTSSVKSPVMLSVTSMMSSPTSFFASERVDIITLCLMSWGWVGWSQCPNSCGVVGYQTRWRLTCEEIEVESSRDVTSRVKYLNKGNLRLGKTLQEYLNIGYFY